MQTAEMVLQQMQMLDQQVAPPLAVAEQGLHLGERRRIDLPALRRDPARAAAPSRDECAGRVLVGMHIASSKPLSRTAGEGAGPRRGAGG